MKLETKNIKNGNKIIAITTSVDESKPKCYTEGMQYKFNSEIVKTEVISEVVQELKNLYRRIDI